MAAEWCFTPQSQDASRVHKEYEELYERAREATREAQRQGDAQLKAAMAAATAVPNSSVRICPLSLTFNNTGLERAYWQNSSTNSDKKDVIPFAFQFFVRVTLIILLFQTRGGQRIAAVKEDVAFLHLPNFSTRLISYLWIAAICATMLVVHFRYSSWYRGNRGTILWVAASSLWLGEGVTVLASCPESTLDLALILAQCIFMSVLHRVPFCLHLKTRLLGFGLQIIGTLARGVKVDEAIPALLYFSMGHSLGVALAYILDLKSRVGFLKSFPQFVSGKMSGDPQLCHQQIPRRALGGFAGGFAGVSSLKCTPSLWTVSSSSHNGSSWEDCISEVSCSSSSTVENGINDVSSSHRYFSCWCPPNKDKGQSSDKVCSGHGLECNVYWHFRAGARDGFDG